MEWSAKPGEYIPPVRCPQCGECQNRFSGRVSPEDQTFEKIDCMVCGRVFNPEEYRGLVSDALANPASPIHHLD